MTSWQILSYLPAEQETYTVSLISSRLSQSPPPPRPQCETYRVSSLIYYLESTIDLYNFSWVRSLVIHCPHIQFDCRKSNRLWEYYFSVHETVVVGFICFWQRRALCRYNKLNRVDCLGNKLSIDRVRAKKNRRSYSSEKAFPKSEIIPSPMCRWRDLKAIWIIFLDLSTIVMNKGIIWVHNELPFLKPFCIRQVPIPYLEAHSQLLLWFSCAGPKILT